MSRSRQTCRPMISTRERLSTPRSVKVFKVCGDMRRKCKCKVCVWERERERERNIHILYSFTLFYYSVWIMKYVLTHFRCGTWPHNWSRLRYYQLKKSLSIYVYICICICIPYLDIYYIYIQVWYIHIYHTWEKIIKRRHPGNWVPWLRGQKRRKIVKTNSKSKEKFAVTASVIFWLPSLLKFFQVWDIYIHM